MTTKKIELCQLPNKFFLPPPLLDYFTVSAPHSLLVAFLLGIFSPIIVGRSPKCNDFIQLSAAADTFCNKPVEALGLC